MSLDAIVVYNPGGSIGQLQYNGGNYFVGAGWKLYGTQGNERLVAPGLTDDGSTSLQIGNTYVNGGWVKYYISTGAGAFYTGARGGGQTGLFLDSVSAPTYPKFFLDSLGRFYLNPNALSALDANSIDGSLVVGGRSNVNVALFRSSDNVSDNTVWQKSDGTTYAKITNVGSGIFGGVQATVSDGVASSITNTRITGHNTTATASTGFGLADLYRLQSSTTADRNAAEIDVTWANATDASRKARMTLGVYDNTALRKAIQIDTNGTVPQITLPSGASFNMASGNIQMNGSNIFMNNGSGSNGGTLFMDNGIINFGGSVTGSPGGTGAPYAWIPIVVNGFTNAYLPFYI